MSAWIAGTLLVLLLLAGVVIVALAFLDRLPLPKQPSEPTPMQREMDEFSRSLKELERKIGVAMLPAVQRMAESVNRFSRSGKDKP